MLTILLWIFLIIFGLIFLAFVSPIRFGVFASYDGSGHLSYSFFVSYLHPIFFKLFYSSENGNSLKILGINFKLKSLKKVQSSEDKNFEDSKDSNKESIEPQTDESEHFSAEHEETSHYDGEVAKSEEGQQSQVIEKTPESGEPAEEHGSLFGKIKEFINKVKKSTAYRFLSDKIWRKKVIAWLGRIFKGVFSIVVFNRLFIWAKVGLMDPAVLGKICGYFCAVRSALSLRYRKADMVLEPIFMKEALEFKIELKGGTSLFRATSCFFIALFTFPYLRTYKLWRKKRD